MKREVIITKVCDTRTGTNERGNWSMTDVREYNGRYFSSNRLNCQRTATQKHSNT